MSNNTIVFEPVTKPSNQNPKNLPYQFVFRSSNLDSSRTEYFSADQVGWLGGNHFVIEASSQHGTAVLEGNIFDKNGELKCLSKLFIWTGDFHGHFLTKTYAFVLSISKESVELIRSCA